MTLAIEVSSEPYGSEIFKYSTQDERQAGLLRLMTRAQQLGDGIPRDYYFGELDEDGDITGDVEHAAQWSGSSWEIAEYGTPDSSSKAVQVVMSVSYSLNGESLENLAQHVKAGMDYGIETGMLSGHTEATVDQYSMDVQIVPANPCFLVIGRVRGHDEDTAVTVHAETLEDARREFTAHIIEVHNEANPEEPYDEAEDAVIITCIAVSDTPIDIQQRSYGI